MSIVFPEAELFGSADSALDVLQALSDRHDTLRAKLVLDGEPYVDLPSALRFPTQSVRSVGSEISPIILDMTAGQGPITDQTLLHLTRGEFARRGENFLPILISQGTKWTCAALVSHTATDGRGVQLILQDYEAIRRGNDMSRAVQLPEILDLESSPSYLALARDCLRYVSETLDAAVCRNLSIGTPREVPLAVEIESPRFSIEMQQLSTTLRTSRPTIAGVIFAILLSSEYDSERVLLRSMVRRDSPFRKSVSIAADTALAYVSLRVDRDLSFRELVTRERKAFLKGYRWANFPPVEYQSLLIKVAERRGLSKINGIPVMNYLASTRGSSPLGGRQPILRRDMRVREAHDIDIDTIDTLGGFEVTEGHGIDSIRMFGCHWQFFDDSLDVLRTIESFVHAASRDPDRSVEQLLAIARSSHAEEA
jgi:hypothetical protein